MRRVSAPGDRIVLIGAGTSALALDLARGGGHRLTAVDISDTALDELRSALGPDGEAVRYVVADVRNFELDHLVDVWHDRATFHFLTTSDDQRAYVARATAAVRPGGHVVLAGFAPDGPEQCSGLPVARHSLDELTGFFDAFELLEAEQLDHTTPWGSTQRFLHTLFRRLAVAG